MKANILTRVSTVLILFSFLMMAFTPGDTIRTNSDYILIAWNDLGMHCSNGDFSKAVVLPPYNNVMAQVILKGSSTSNPQIIAQDSLVIDYEIPGNTYSVGKTNFWTYDQTLFGVNLPDNVGLTGEGLTGSLTKFTDYYMVEGIPLTPYQDTDLVNESPFQLGLLTLKNLQNDTLATTQPVIPVSNEINCVSSGCHSSQQNILNEHENVSGFNSNGPVLCASCHSSNALGTTGQPGLESLSEVVHKKHRQVNDCYKCHPGPNTQCHRGAMYTEGFGCIDCHGTTQNVGNSISNGREPWLEEPSCSATNCHTSTYAPQAGLLYRQSKGHGGLYCSACHGSPHAYYPSEEANDNVQNIAIQGFAGPLSDCSVCHGTTPTAAGPHGIIITNIVAAENPIGDGEGIQSVFPNPVRTNCTIRFALSTPEFVKLDVYSIEGRLVNRLINRKLDPGSYDINYAVRDLPNGIYNILLKTPDSHSEFKLIKVD